MNPSQSPPSSKDEPRPRIDEALVPETTEDTEDTPDVTDAWLLFASGSLAAVLITSQLLPTPQPHHLPWPILFFQAIGYIALTLAAGFTGMWIPWFFFGARSSFNPRFFSANVAVGWVFLPCILLLHRQRSQWMFPAIALATVAVALSLRRLLPYRAGQIHDEPSNRQTGDLPTLYGLAIADFQPLRAFVIALCAQAALISAVVGHLWLAGILLSTGLFLVVWRWTTFDQSVLRRFTGRKPPVLLSVFALLLTFLLLIPAISRGLRGVVPQNESLRKPPAVVRQPSESGKPNFDYVGIVLWPPPKKKTRIVPPPPPAPSVARGAPPKPVVIPFDGPYWYFKAPNKKPGPHAHIAHGNATDVNIRSDDRAPLLMEAHQNLGASIVLRCCSEIDVDITNADDRLGKIALGVLLTDSNSLGKPFQYLSERTIASSEDLQIPFNRPPVKETLRFPISRSATLHRFNEITILFLPAKERALGGARVSIQSFTLIPK